MTTIEAEEFNIEQMLREMVEDELRFQLQEQPPKEGGMRSNLVSSLPKEPEQHTASPVSLVYQSQTKDVCQTQYLYQNPNIPKGIEGFVSSTKEAKITPSSYLRQRQLTQKVNNEINKISQKAFKEYQASHPEAAGLKCKNANYCYAKKSRAYYDAPIKIFSCLTDRHFISKTQKEILAWVQRECADKLSPNVWTRELSPRILKRINIQLECSGLSPKPALSGLKTLSEIRKQMQKHFRLRGETKHIKADIIMSNDSLTIGHQAYPLVKTTKNSRTCSRVRVTVHGRRQWINTDALLALLEGKEIAEQTT